MIAAFYRPWSRTDWAADTHIILHVVEPVKLLPHAFEYEPQFPVNSTGDIGSFLVIASAVNGDFNGCGMAPKNNGDTLVWKNVKHGKIMKQLWAHFALPFFTTPLEEMKDKSGE